LLIYDSNFFSSNFVNHRRVGKINIITDGDLRRHSNNLYKKTILPLKNFFVNYRKTKLKKRQFIHSIIIPVLKKNIFKASGSVIKFDGYLKLSIIDDDNEDDKILPDVNKGDIEISEFKDEQHFTQPQPRYSEASLVKKLEELGIGRPSTYASIISVIANRGYADINNKRFFPTDRGKLLSAFLEKLFSKYVDYDFTAKLEDQLDDITSGKEDWIKVLEHFWKDFNLNISNVKEKRTREVLDLLNESLGSLIFEIDKDGKIDRKCKLCDSGQLSLKNSFRGGAS